MAEPYWEMDGSPTETWDQIEGVVAHRQLGCLWIDRYYWMNWFLVGLGQTYEHHTDGVLRARRGTIKPFEAEQKGVDTKTAYEWALLDIEFLAPELHKTDAGDLFSESLEPQAEFISLDHALFRWKGTEYSPGPMLEPDEAPGKPLLSMDYVLTRYGVLAVPDATFDLIGHVNDEEFESYLLGKTFAAETLLYNPPPLTRKVNTDYATAGWNITYRLSYRPPPGWNWFWRADKGTSGDWDQIVRKSDGADYKNFPLGDFELLRS